MAKLFGKASIRVNGQLLASLPGASIDLGGTVRQPVIGNEYLGHAESEKEAMVECEIALRADTKPEDIHNADTLTVTFELDTGQTYVIREAVSAEPPVISGGNPEGKTGFKFIGPRAELVG